MIFRKKRPSEPEPEETQAAPVPAAVMEVLDRLEKGGGQLTVRTADGTVKTDTPPPDTKGKQQ